MPVQKDKDLWQCALTQFKICFDPEGWFKKLAWFNQKGLLWMLFHCHR